MAPAVYTVVKRNLLRFSLHYLLPMAVITLVISISVLGLSVSPTEVFAQRATPTSQPTATPTLTLLPGVSPSVTPTPTACPAMSAPTNLVYTFDTTTKDYIFTWDSVAGATFYKTFLRDLSGPSNISSQTSFPTYSIPLNRSHLYVFYVIPASASCGEGAISNYLSVPAIPDSPTPMFTPTITPSPSCIPYPTVIACSYSDSPFVTNIPCVQPTLPTGLNYCPPPANCVVATNCAPGDTSCPSTYYPPGSIICPSPSATPYPTTGTTDPPTATPTTLTPTDLPTATSTTLTPTYTPIPCPAGEKGNLDCSADSCINTADFELFRQAFGNDKNDSSLMLYPHTPDLFQDDSNIIDTADYQIFYSNFATCSQ